MKFVVMRSVRESALILLLVLQRVDNMNPVIIGNATLYNSDCRDVLPMLTEVDAVITDPPYGLNIGNTISSKETRNGFLVKQNYDSYDDSVSNLVDIIIPSIKYLLGLTDRALVFCADKHIWRFPEPSAIGGVYIPAACGRNCYGFSSLAHVLLYGKAPNLHKGAKQTVLRSTEISEKNGHPMPKPIGWMKWAVDLVTVINESIIDPFMGSGTTGVAAVQMDRKFIGIEIDNKYFDIACKRIENAQRQQRMF